MSNIKRGIVNNIRILRGGYFPGRIKFLYNIRGKLLETNKMMFLYFRLKTFMILI